jgi:hypothetical protein
MRPNCILLWTAGALAVLLAALPARAIDAPGRPPVSALGKIRDLALTVRARRALQEDRVLSTLNLGVWVENGVASVWGPVPSEQVGRQAVAKLEAVKGVVEVRTDFHVRGPDAGKDQIAGLSPGQGSLDRFDVFKRDREEPPPRQPATPVAVAREAPRLLAPRAVSAPRRQPEAAVVGRERPSLAEQIERLRGADPRFRDVLVRIQGTTLEVRRGDPDEHAVAFANQLRHIRGVTDVILTDE